MTNGRPYAHDPLPLFAEPDDRPVSYQAPAHSDPAASTASFHGPDRA
ncbi:hypothetical protein [Krasilnikovia sp. M28-CT-15]